MVIDARHRLATVRKLPYDAEIEYLESTGTQWIDTKIVPDSTTVCLADIMYLNTSTQQFGSGRPAGNLWAVLFGYYQGVTRLWADIPQTGINLNRATGVRFSCGFDILNATYNVDGITMHSDYITTPTGVVQSFALFGRKNSDENYSNLCKMRLYAFAISSSATSVNLIPVRFTNELGQSEGAMYDKVSGQLFRNQGSGEFVMGPDLVPYDAEVEYLESTGTQYIDTGLMAHSNIGWKIDGQILVGTDNYTVLIGAHDWNDDWYCEIYERGSEGFISNEAWYGKNVCSLIGLINTRTIATFNFLGDGTAFINPSENLTDRQNIDWTAFHDYDVNYCLFASGSNRETTAGYVMAFSQSRIYSCRMSDGSTMARDFIPVRVGTTGYMYDKANPKGGPLGNGLYPNQGSGDFILGKDVAYPKRKFEITYRKPQIWIKPPTARDYISD